MSTNRGGAGHGDPRPVPAATPPRSTTSPATRSPRWSTDYDPARINAVVLLTDGVNDDGDASDDRDQLDELLSHPARGHRRRERQADPDLPDRLRQAGRLRHARGDRRGHQRRGLRRQQPGDHHQGLHRRGLQLLTPPGRPLRDRGTQGGGEQVETGGGDAELPGSVLLTARRAAPSPRPRASSPWAPARPSASSPPSAPAAWPRPSSAGVVGGALGYGGRVALAIPRKGAARQHRPVRRERAVAPRRPRRHPGPQPLQRGGHARFQTGPLRDSHARDQRPPRRGRRGVLAGGQAGPARGRRPQADRRPRDPVGAPAGRRPDPARRPRPPPTQAQHHRLAATPSWPRPSAWTR